MIKPGQKYIDVKDSTFYLKIMAIVDGYVMAKYKGCIPFVESVKKFNDRLTHYFLLTKEKK